MTRLGCMLLTLLTLTPTALWWVTPVPPPRHRAVVEAGCDLDRAPCRAQLADGRSLTLGVGPRPVPLLAPIEVTLQSATLRPIRAAIGITGVEVDMGLTRAQFVATAQGWRATTELGLCSRSEMNWRLLLELELAGGERVVALFPLHTRYRPRFIIVGE